MAGRQTGQIKARINDYKRNQQTEVFKYERAFIREYIDVPLKFNVGAYATSSGMAAFTTIVNYLQIIKSEFPYILVGNSVYFESKLMLEAIYKDKCIFVDEGNAESVIFATRKYSPGVIFLDTISNDEKIVIPRINVIIDELVQNTRNNPYLVIDNTVASIMYQPFKNLLFKKQVNMIVYESLNKYHQFGMDRVTGGMIYLKSNQKEHVFEARDHLGTQITDVNVISLPKPDRRQLKAYLDRLSRNSLTVAQNINRKHKRITGVNFPAIPNHQSFDQVKSLGFAGSFLTLSIRNRLQNKLFATLFVKNILAEARKNHVQLVYGTSFGLPSSRVYYIDSHEQGAENFLRVAPGLETMYEIYRLVHVLNKTL